MLISRNLLLFRNLQDHTSVCESAMPGGRASGKQSGKPSRQLLFSEALQNSRAPSPASELQALTPPGTMTEPVQGATTDRILQEISAVGRRLEGMDNAMASLTAETKSMRLDIAGFQSRELGLEQRVSTVETHITSFTDRDQELLHLRSKLIDLEDRSRRDNVRFLGFPETIEGADIHSYLRETLPKLTGLTFDPPLEFQRVHRLGPKRQEDANRPHPIIACLLRHVQTRQLIQAARSHGAFRMDGLEIRLTADFSKETRERRRAFLALSLVCVKWK
ncbi:hypothetical protein NDU88_006089 [Pleurodeles waltl]|uniref:L1 transposable element RRM domain-containing protein n=1 Tax=Pleurodeles waltl TaxID=8319 RepID=A0AAV7LPS7_PLEWA|nr:hypothetical protein NDU88_006089 [Pleurodeles waltl]